MEWTTGRTNGKAAKFVFLLVMLAAGATAYAGPTNTYSFTCITNNSAANAAAGEAQLSMDVIGVDSSQVEFRFNNVGPVASSICDIYFDDSSLLDDMDIIDGPGVAFSSPANPGNLPGANNISPAFVTTTGLSADSDPPAMPNGVNPGESLSILFDFEAGKTYADVVNALASGALRVGLHVQGFPNEGSEAFVNDPPHVPAPGAILLASLGLASLGWVRQRKILG